MADELAVPRGAPAAHPVATSTDVGVDAPTPAPLEVERGTTHVQGSTAEEGMAEEKVEEEMAAQQQDVVAWVQKQNVL